MIPDHAHRSIAVHRPARRAVFVVTLLLVSALCVSCEPRPTTPAKPTASAPSVTDLRTEPTVRVRVVQSGPFVRIDSPGGLRVGALAPPHGSSGARPFMSPVIVRRVAGAFYLTTPDGQTLRWDLPAVMVEPARPDAITIDSRPFPGSVAVHPSRTGGAETGAIDAVNHVPLEPYIAGVLDRELYAGWHQQAFNAQAIAARSYAVSEQSGAVGRHFDLESTTASQAYGGVSVHGKSVQAVRDTRGRVLTWQGRVLRAYYSSSTGGAGQDAAFAFPNGPDIPPLRGREHGGWSSASKYFRWGPVTRDRVDTTKRLVAWGRANKHGVAQLQALASIQVSQRNSVGRPAQFTLRDTQGRTYTMRAEEFRFACNFEAPGLATLPPTQLLRSSHVTPTVAANAVHFTDGRGFGHGVGMDQHGAQAMAQRGYTADSILAFYYPGARIEKAY